METTPENIPQLHPNQRFWEKQVSDHLNMMAAPISKEYPATMTRIVGNDFALFKYRSRVYWATIDEKKSIATRSIQISL